MVAFYAWKGEKKYATKPKYFFALMTTEGFKGGCTHSLMAAAAEMTRDEINFDISTQVGNCHVDDARNELVDRFLDSDCSHLVFIDSDIIFDYKSLKMLLDCPEPLCGASYPYKDGSGDFPATVEGTSYPDHRGYVPIDGLPTGFMKISREVFETLKPHVEHYFAKTTNGANVGLYFQRTISGNVRTGGDISFCRLWKKHGDGKVWLVPKAVLGHTGDRTAEGSFWFKQDCLTNGVWPAVRDAIVEDRWENEQVLRAAFNQWGNMGFSGDTGLLQAMMGVMKELPAGEILEMGSGITTVWLSTTGRKITSLEEDRAFLGKTWGVLDDFGKEFRERVQLLHCQSVEGKYKVPEGVLDKEYALCLVDGPAELHTMHGRPQALDVNAKAWLFDDCQRPLIMGTIKKLEERGHKSVLLPVPGRFVVLVVRNEE